MRTNLDSLAAMLASAVFCLPALAGDSQAAAEGAKVAVFVEPGMVVYGAPSSLPAGAIARELAKRGLPADVLDSRQLADPAAFNAGRYAVLVMAYGNAFPLDAFENVRAFHRAGGCLVGNGTPFCHPCLPPEQEAGGKKTSQEWRDLGHDGKYFAHDDFGMGTGGFLGPGDKESQLSVVRDNPLGLRDEALPRRSARAQGLDRSSLAPQDEVLPLVNAQQPGGKAYPAAALIRHRCARFHEARDAWLGRLCGGLAPQDRHAATQLVARAVAWCLQEKGLLGREEFQALLARLDSEEKPKPFPDQLEIDETPRPWGQTFFPKSNPPAKELLAVNVQGLSAEERLALICLQGLTARRQPRIWLIHTEKDLRWLERHEEMGCIEGRRMEADWRGLFRRFAGEYKGAVVPDDKLYGGALLACNVASCEDLIVAPPKLAEELGLERKIDLRGRFATYAEGMRWVWETYKGRLNHHLCMCLHPPRAASGALSYDIEWRSVIFWISGPGESEEPGADSFAEQQAMAEIFAQMPPNIGMRGFTAGGPNAGLGEGVGVEFCGGYGKGLVASGLTGNMCVMSGVRVESLAAPAPLPPPPLEKDKVYIALAMSDGDNVNTFVGYFDKYFEHPSHGAFPMAWGMGPAILDLMPGVAQWYYQHAKPADEFLADVSGVAYVYPQSYGSRYREQARVFEGFLDWTSRYMQRLGMRTIRAHGHNSADPQDLKLEAQAAALPFVHSFFPDYARHVKAYEDSVFQLPGGTPVFRALTRWNYGREGLLRDIREQVGPRRPAFVNAFVHNWTFDMDALRQAYDGRDADMVFVTPAQLAALFREAAKSE